MTCQNSKSQLRKYHQDHIISPHKTEVTTYFFPIHYKHLGSEAVLIPFQLSIRIIMPLLHPFLFAPGTFQEELLLYPRTIVNGHWNYGDS